MQSSYFLGFVQVFPPNFGLLLDASGGDCFVSADRSGWKVDGDGQLSGHPIPDDCVFALRICHFQRYVIQSRHYWVRSRDSRKSVFDELWPVPIFLQDDLDPWWTWGYWTSPAMYGTNALAINEFLDSRWAQAKPLSLKR